MSEIKPDVIYTVKMGGQDMELHAPTDFIIRWKHLGAQVLHYYNTDERKLQNVWMPSEAVPILQEAGIRILDLPEDDIYQTEFDQYVETQSFFMDDSWLEQ